MSIDKVEIMDKNCINDTEKFSGEVTCRLCNSSQTIERYVVEGHKIHQCKDCHMIFSKVEVEVSQAIYNHDYYIDHGKEKGGYVDYVSMKKTHQTSFSDRLKTVENILGHKGVMIDYGCALGHLCEVASKRGWNIFGSDLTLFGTKYTKEKYNVDTFVSDVTSPPLKKNTADAVCMYDLIEHIPDPQKALVKIREVLKPNGCLHLVTPDVESFSAKILGGKWFHFKPVEHLFYFSQKSMKEILESSGYEVYQIRSARSHMTLGDIFNRLSVYLGSFLSSKINILLKMFKLHDLVVKIYVGNLEAFAFPNKPEEQECISNDIENIKLQELITCVNCDGDLDGNYSCQGCGAQYEQKEGVPVLLKDELSEKLIKKHVA